MKKSNFLKKSFCLMSALCVFSASTFHLHAQTLKENDLKLIDIKGNYTYVGGFEDGFAIAVNATEEFRTVKKEDGGEERIRKVKFGYINTSGEEVLPVEYGSATRFLNGRASAFDFESENIAYLFNTKFEKIGGNKDLKDGFMKALYPFYDEISVTYLDENNRQFINLDGRLLSDYAPKWKDIYALTPFSEGLAFAKVKNARGEYNAPVIIDKNGKTVARLQENYYSYGIFQNGISAVAIPNEKSDNKKALLWGFVDKSGKEIIECQYDEIVDDHDYYKADKLGYIQVRKGDKWMLIDKKGKQVLPGYDAYGYRRFEEGLCSVMKDGKWGFIDEKGKEIIAPQYDVVWAFSNGLAAFKLGDKFGYLDKAGNVVIEPTFYDASDFDGDYAKVRSGSDWKILVHPNAK